MLEIYQLPKDVQKYILEYVSYPYIVQQKDLLEDIRDFTESYQLLHNIFYKRTCDELIDISNYSNAEIAYHKNYIIFYNILLELDHPSISIYGINTNYFYSVLSRLYMFRYHWYLRYQYDGDDDIYLYNPTIINKIRFLFGLMNVHERFNMLFYYYNENLENEDYDP
jgi:hypothetical protein